MHTDMHTMPPTRRAALAALATMLAGGLAGCNATSPRVNARSPGQASPPLGCQAVGDVPHPQGVDLPRMQLLDGGVRWAVASRLKPSHEIEGAWRSLPPPLAQALSATQVDHLLADAIRGSRRFTWFDASFAPTNAHYNTRIELMLLPVEQQLKRVGSGWLKLHTRVPVSATLTDLETGQDLLGSDLAATGHFGHISGSGAQVRAEQELDLPHHVEGRRHDIRAALADALDQLRHKLERKLLPIARVEIAEGCGLQLSGGSLHGLQAGDRLTVFRPRFMQRDGLRVLAGAQPVALARCDGVGAQFSHCQVQRQAPGLQAQAGDYAVLQAESLQQLRTE